jgi:hypothetical protein
VNTMTKAYPTATLRDVFAIHLRQEPLKSLTDRRLRIGCIVGKVRLEAGHHVSEQVCLLPQRVHEQRAAG